jgi:hypothetical protein
MKLVQWSHVLVVSAAAVVAIAVETVVVVQVVSVVAVVVIAVEIVAEAVGSPTLNLNLEGLRKRAFFYVSKINFDDLIF